VTLERFWGTLSTPRAGWRSPPGRMAGFERLSFRLSDGADGNGGRRPLLEIHDPQIVEQHPCFAALDIRAEAGGEAELTGGEVAVLGG